MSLSGYSECKHVSALVGSLIARSPVVAYICVSLGKAHLGFLYRLAFSSCVRAGPLYSTSRAHHDLTNLGTRIGHVRREA
jgi:hypothetical protein